MLRHFSLPKYLSSDFQELARAVLKKLNLKFLISSVFKIFGFCYSKTNVITYKVEARQAKLKCVD